MKSKLIAGEKVKTYALIFDAGDEMMKGLLDFAEQNNLSADSFKAIGAFERVTGGFFDLEKQDYHKNKIDEQVEVVSIIGDVALKDEKPKVHAHVVVAKRDGTAHGGHLIDAIVRPTLEVILTESPAKMRRKYNEKFGLALIDLDA
ncbi:MAG: PPC domain-containing DNA-binding protein [Pyrinomonadaceae bacterium]